LARWLQFGYGSLTPPPVKIHPKMPCTKQSRLSFAPPNPTKPSHPDVNCVVAVEQLQELRIIFLRAEVDDDEVQWNHSVIFSASKHKKRGA
jgi:hypothetical protein